MKKAVVSSMGRCNAEMITRRRIRGHDEALADATGLSHETAFAQLDVHNPGHDLDVKSRVHPKYTTTYRVGNWAEYDRALVRRGDVTLWLTPDATATWAAAGVGRRSGQLQYSDLAIETALTLSLLFH